MISTAIYLLVLTMHHANWYLQIAYDHVCLSLSMWSLQLLLAQRRGWAWHWTHVFDVHHPKEQTKACFVLTSDGILRCPDLHVAVVTSLASNDFLQPSGVQRLASQTAHMQCDQRDVTCKLGHCVRFCARHELGGCFMEAKAPDPEGSAAA